MTIIDVRATLPRRPEFDAGTSEGRTSATVHWEGGAVPASGELADEHEHLKRVAQFHIDKDWTSEVPGAQHGGGLMYELAVGRSGNVYRCRDPLAVLWHAGRATANALSLPVLVLCGPGQPPTPEQLKALAALLADLKLAPFPHRHWSSTECPGPELLAWLASPPSDAARTAYASSTEPLVKETQREMLRKDPETRALVLDIVREALAE